MSDKVKKPRSVELSEILSKLEEDANNVVTQLSQHLAKIKISDDERVKIQNYDEEIAKLLVKKAALQEAIDKLQPVIDLKQSARDSTLVILADRFDVSVEDILNKLGN